jgi:hypothetical protein
MPACYDARSLRGALRHVTAGEATLMRRPHCFCADTWTHPGSVNLAGYAVAVAVKRDESS